MTRIRRIAFAFLFAATPLLVRAEVFFSDTFINGSTLNQLPTAPTTSLTSYQSLAGVTGAASSINPNRLTLVFPNTTAVLGEILARFGSTPVALTTVGDHIALTVVFVNASNILSGTLNNNASINIGLFNSSGVAPNQGHIVSGSGNITGGTEDWIGYAARIFFNGNSTIFARPVQTPAGLNSRNQDLLFTGASGTQAFGEPTGAALGGSTAGIVSLVQGSTNTLHLVITLSAAGTLTVSNALYAGVEVSGTPTFSQQRTASGATLLTSGFDGFAVGWRNSAPAAQASAMEVLSIEISGQSTTVSTPPDILMEPVTVTVSSGGSAAFAVTAQGFNLAYQWHRHGTNLVDGGNISGANSDLLVISPASSADVAGGANGYYVTVTGAGGFSTNSTTNSLTLVAAKNLTWAGPGDAWDLNTSANWLDAGNSPSAFNFGDAVTFNGGQPTGVILSGRYLSASSVTVEGSTGYAFSGSGSFAGPGRLIFTGSFLDIANANSYSGGTIISNETAYLYLRNYNGLGTGPITLAKAGGKLEVVPAGSASLGINGDFIVADDFTIQFDGAGTFAGVIFGNLAGTAGKTLTLTPANTSSTNRYRVYGATTTYDANLIVDGPAVSMANYQGSTLAPYHTGGSQTYNGIISGNGGLVQRGNGTTILNGQNTYSGGTTPTAGTIGFGADTVGNVTSGPIGAGPLFLAPELPNTTGSGTVLAFGGARTIANPLQYPSATNNQTLIVGGTNDLTFSGPFTLNGDDGSGTFTNRTLQVANTALTTISGVISGNGFGLIKTGNGTLALSNTETYTGPTAISNGTLRVNGQLDVGAVTVVTNATLGGSGTILGPVTVLDGGNVAPGNSIGTLIINNNLSLLGNLNIEVNTASAPTSDRVIVSGTLVNTGAGTLTVSNLGSALVGGEKFTLFNKSILNGSALTVSGGGVGWVNDLAADGSITATFLAPPTLNFIQTGNNLQFSWTGNFKLQAQTNGLNVGVSSNWGDYPAGTTSPVSVPITVANGTVFFRLSAP